MEIFTTCKQCGKLLFIPKSIWDVISSNPNSDKNSNAIISQPPLKRNCDVTILVDPQQTESYLNFVEETKTMTFNKNNVYFPLCPDCSTTYIQHLKNYRKLFEKTSELIDKKFTNIPKDVFNIQYQNAISPSETRGLLKPQQNTTSSPKKKLKRRQLKQIKQNLHSSPKDKICPDPLDFTNPRHRILPLLMDISSKPKTFCPMESCYVFKISANRHYGTINDLRIGFFKYYRNTILENNIGLSFILHLIYHLKRAFNSDVIRIRLHPHPAISLQDGPFYKLIVPENKKHQKLDEINNAIHSLFVAFNIINDASMVIPNIKYSMPPYEINTEIRTVGDISYDFNWKTIEEWSVAMRLFLVDLKMIQFRSLRTAFLH
ncbi:hypothetical protein TRFO_25551 [Tritrichomonas foetus]|uniref:Atg6 BARA domain-containing protein n=1 Tax=Tritrichomonas foetus TaxID=1144522 RepID=A0A1J4KAF6_9EUKA|nr:hypothetical protein TRFO_25551 [Tritrichomonas foetus]|eukprot:OHT06437.1 hypothetical protein TRFO_25551 [Tritrichomonas foetus]